MKTRRNFNENASNSWVIRLALPLILLVYRAAVATCPVLIHSSGSGHALPLSMDMSVQPGQKVPVLLSFDHDLNSYTLLDPAANAGAEKQEPDSWTIAPQKTTKIQVAPSRNGVNPGVIGLSVKVSGIEPS